MTCSINQYFPNQFSRTYRHTGCCLLLATCSKSMYSIGCGSPGPGLETLLHIEDHGLKLLFYGKCFIKRYQRQNNEWYFIRISFVRYFICQHKLSPKATNQHFDFNCAVLEAKSKGYATPIKKSHYTLICFIRTAKHKRHRGRKLRIRK